MTKMMVMMIGGDDDYDEDGSHGTAVFTISGYVLWLILSVYPYILLAIILFTRWVW